MGAPPPNHFLPSDSSESSELWRPPNPNIGVGGSVSVSVWDHADLAGSGGTIINSNRMAFPPPLSSGGRGRLAAPSAADSYAAGRKNGTAANATGRMHTQKKHPPTFLLQEEAEARTVVLKLAVPANTPVPPPPPGGRLDPRTAGRSVVQPVAVQMSSAVGGASPVNHQRQMVPPLPAVSPLPGRPLSPVVIFSNNNYYNNNNSKKSSSSSKSSHLQPTITRTNTDDLELSGLRHS